MQFNLGGLERPRRMMDLAVDDAVRLYCAVEAVPIGEPVIERARNSLINRSRGSIGRLQLCRRGFPMNALAFIINRLAFYLYFHLSVVVWQSKTASDSDREPIRRVQAKKPDAAPVRSPHIGPHVQLWKSQRYRHIARPHAAHAKRHDTYPA